MCSVPGGRSPRLLPGDLQAGERRGGLIPATEHVEDRRLPRPQPHPEGVGLTGPDPGERLPSLVESGPEVAEDGLVPDLHGEGVEPFHEVETIGKREPRLD